MKQIRRKDPLLRTILTHRRFRPKGRGVGTPYDNVFRNIISEEFRRYILFLINFMHGTQYTGEEKIEFDSDDISLPVDGKWMRIRGDSFLTVIDPDGLRIPYHFECETNPKGDIQLRIAQYQAAKGAQSPKLEADHVEIALPASAGIYLRKPSGNPKSFRIVYTCGGKRLGEVVIPTMTMQDLSLDDLFSHQLLILLPFVLFTLGKSLNRLMKSSRGVHEVLDLLRDLKDRLQKLVETEEISTMEKWRILELTNAVAQNLIKQRKVRKEVNSMIGSAPMRLETDAIYGEGRSAGILIGERRSAKKIAEAQERARKSDEAARKAKDIARKSDEAARKSDEAARKSDEAARKAWQETSRLKKSLETVALAFFREGRDLEYVRKLCPDLTAERLKALQTQAAETGQE